MSGSVNVQNLEIKLVQKINASTSMQDIFALSAALKQLKSGVVYVVQEFNQLPVFSSALSELWFVVNDRILYTNSATAGWYPLVTDTVNMLWTWGQGGNGAQGNNSAFGRCSPGTVSGLGATWCQISAGYRNGAALKTDGTAWTWGRNIYQGLLGDGTVVNRSSPGTLAGGGNTWCQISISQVRSHGAAVKTDGTAWTWGCNSDGQLGDGTVTPRSSPGQVTGTNANWCQINAGGYHTAALKTDGAIWTWGSNVGGQLGDGTVVARSSPGTICGGGTWRQVSAHRFNTAAINSSNVAWTWGGNNFGQLGDGTTVNRSSPVTVAGACTWRQISAGYAQMGAISTAGCLLTWGQNNCGQLGDGTVTNRSSPGNIVGGGTLWCQISAGGRNGGGMAAITTTGCAWTWGYNSVGGLGDGTTVNRSSPVTVVGGISNWCQIGMGVAVTAAIQSRTIG